MVSNISFTSTYKATSQNNGWDRFSSFQDLALEKETEKGVQISLKDKYDTSFPFGYNSYFAQCTITVPDSMDDEIEQYCLYNNINYTKLTNKELLDTNSIEQRIQEPKEGMTLARINAEKTKKLISEQYSNVEHCKDDYRRYFKEKVDFMLKSGDEFPVSTISIIPDSSSTEALVKYIKRNGSDSIEPGTLFIDCVQQTNDPDHCVWLALQNLGMKNIPVYMSANSYKLADALGILER